MCGVRSSSDWTLFKRESTIFVDWKQIRTSADEMWFWKRSLNIIMERGKKTVQKYPLGNWCERDNRLENWKKKVILHTLAIIKRGNISALTFQIIKRKVQGKRWCHKKQWFNNITEWPGLNQVQAKHLSFLTDRVAAWKEANIPREYYVYEM